MKLFKIIKIIAYIFVVFVFLVFMTSFVIENNYAVNLIIFGHSFQSIPLSALVLVVFILGGLIGMFSGTFMVLRLRIANVYLVRKLKRREEELKKLKVSTLRGLS